MPKPSNPVAAKLSTALQFFSVAEVALILNVSTKTVRTWITDGKLPAFHIGPGNRVTRVRRNDLEQFIDIHIRSSKQVNQDQGAEPKGDNT